MAPQDLLKGRIRPSKHDDEPEELSYSESGASTDSDEGIRGHNAPPAGRHRSMRTSLKRQHPTLQDDNDEGSDLSSDDSEDEVGPRTHLRLNGLYIP